MSRDATTSSETPDSPTSLPDAKTVAAYLREYPGFFERHPQLLAELKLPHPSGRAVSLIERQVAALREQNQQLRARLKSLLETASYNDQLLHVTRSLILTLLEEDSLKQIVSVTEANLTTQPGIDACALILLGERPQRSARQQAVERLPQRFPALFQKQRILCQQVDAATVEWLFPDQTESIRSLALSPVKTADGELLAVLALGNSLADHFSDNLDTLFLGFIADALGAVIRRCPH